MIKRKKQITSGKKSQILRELLEPGCSITKLAKSYNVSKKSLYRWRQNHELNNHHGSQIQKAADNNSTGNFVELSVKESDSALKKASLIFDNLSISIEGKISSSKLSGIIKILEGSC
jgi:transposase-like protein